MSQLDLSWNAERVREILGLRPFAEFSNVRRLLNISRSVKANSRQLVWSEAEINRSTGRTTNICIDVVVLALTTKNINPRPGFWLKGGSHNMSQIMSELCDDIYFKVTGEEPPRGLFRWHPEGSRPRSSIIHINDHEYP